MKTIPKDDWSFWAASPVTQAYLAHLTEIRNSRIEEMLNLQAGESLEDYAIKSIALRHLAEGLAEAIDIESVEQFLVLDEEGHERA